MTQAASMDNTRDAAEVGMDMNENNEASKARIQFQMDQDKVKQRSRRTVDAAMLDWKLLDKVQRQTNEAVLKVAKNS